MKIGKDSVVYGKVPEHLNVGDRSVVVGTTDDRGNTILTTQMAVGYGAKAGPGSIAFGAHAGANTYPLEFPLELKEAMSGLIKHALQRNNEELIASIKTLASEINQPEPQTSGILKAWQGVQSLATIDGATNLLSSAAAGILTYIAKSGA